jgi:hypothetical protein
MHVLSVLAIVIAQVASSCYGWRASFVSNPRLGTRVSAQRDTEQATLQLNPDGQRSEALQFNPSWACRLGLTTTVNERSRLPHKPITMDESLQTSSRLDSTRKIHDDFRQTEATPSATKKMILDRRAVIAEIDMLLEELKQTPVRGGLSRRKTMKGSMAVLAAMLLGNGLVPSQPAEAVGIRASRDLPARAVNFFDVKPANAASNWRLGFFDPKSLEGSSALNPRETLDERAAWKKNGYSNGEAIVKLLRNGKGDLPPPFQLTDADLEDVRTYALEQA